MDSSFIAQKSTLSTINLRMEWASEIDIKFSSPVDSMPSEARAQRCLLVPSFGDTVLHDTRSLSHFLKENTGKETHNYVYLEKPVVVLYDFVARQ